MVLRSDCWLDARCHSIVFDAYVATTCKPSHQSSASSPETFMNIDDRAELFQRGEERPCSTMSAYGPDSSLGGRRPHTTGRQPSNGGHHQLAPMAIAIPGTQRRQEVPPPLPPPRYPDLMDEDDFAAVSQGPTWQWDREGSFGNSRGSSLAVNNFPPSWGRRGEDDRAPSQPDYRRRQSDNDAIRSPRDPRYNLSCKFDEGYHSMSVGTPSMSPR